METVQLTSKSHLNNLFSMIDVGVWKVVWISWKRLWTIFTNYAKFVGLTDRLLSSANPPVIFQRLVFRKPEVTIKTCQPIVFNEQIFVSRICVIVITFRHFKNLCTKLTIHLFRVILGRALDAMNLYEVGRVVVVARVTQVPSSLKNNPTNNFWYCPVIRGWKVSFSTPTMKMRIFDDF